MCIEIVKSDAAFHKPFLLLYRISAKNAAPQDLNEALEYISKAPKDLNETSEDLHKPQNYSEMYVYRNPLFPQEAFHSWLSEEAF